MSLVRTFSLAAALVLALGTVPALAQRVPPGLPELPADDSAGPIKHIASTAPAEAVDDAVPAVPLHGYQLPIHGGGLAGAFWISPPLAGRYSCPMDPQVHANAPGTCPLCHMDLELAPTRVRIALAGSQRSLVGRSVRLAVYGRPGKAQTLRFGADGTAEGSFVMPPGTYTIVAELVAPDSGRHLKLVAPYKAR